MSDQRITTTQDIVDAHYEAADRIDLLEKLVLQYRNDLNHPVTDAESLERRLDAINKAMAYGSLMDKPDN